MTPKKSERPARWRPTILRIAAFILLALAAADLAMPQLCGEDQPLAQRQASTHRITAPTADEDQPPVQQHDDCFCCCAHILAGHMFVLARTGTHDTIPQGVTTQSLPAIVHLIDLPPRAA